MTSQQKWEVEKKQIVMVRQKKNYNSQCDQSRQVFGHLGDFFEGLGASKNDPKIFN